MSQKMALDKKTMFSFLQICFTLLLQQVYGKAINDEIYNGYNAQLGQFPFQALLFNKINASTSTFCSGSLISQRYVLTAAHCSYRVLQTRVYLGLTDTQNGIGAYYYDVPAQDTFVNENYNPTNYQNDIAILKLPLDITYSNYIQPIKLPYLVWAPPTTFDNYSVTASGWGQTQNTEQGPHQILQYRTVNKYPQSSCVSYYTNVNKITDGMICTDKQVVYAGPCHGDSGGPLTVNWENELYLIGAVSWGVGNCSSTNPVVFTNVAYYLKWINSKTGIAIS